MRSGGSPKPRTHHADQAWFHQLPCRAARNHRVLDRLRLAIIVMGLLSVRLAPAAAADWQTDDWHLVPATNSAEKRPAPIRNIARTAAGTLLGTRSAGSSIEL